MLFQVMSDTQEMTETHVTPSDDDDERYDNEV